MWFLLFPRGDKKLLCCNAFDFSMSWDGVLPSLACLFLSVFAASDYLRSLLTFFGILWTDCTFCIIFKTQQHHLFFLFFCVRENYFLQLFLKNFLQDIDKYCIYSDYTVKLKTYLILILYLLLSVFVCWTDLTRNKFLRLCVYYDNLNHFKLIDFVSNVRNSCCVSFRHEIWLYKKKA